MPYLHTRTLLPLVAFIALAAGCGPKQQSTDAAAAPTPKSTRDALSSDDVTRNPNVPIEEMLRGKIAGVVVSRTEDGGIAVRIRGGSSSFSGNNEPLYVLDGVAITPGPNGSLMGINPYDIASIKVLKDPADITMYGVRGANGVILIKTKKPNQ
jgi:TonB-dependent SusC/RagA subfamily outer membrane receptor